MLFLYLIIIGPSDLQDVWEYIQVEKNKKSVSVKLALQHNIFFLKLIIQNSTFLLKLVLQQGSFRLSALKFRNKDTNLIELIFKEYVFIMLYSLFTLFLSIMTGLT